MANNQLYMMECLLIALPYICSDLFDGKYKNFF
jgi:hypothetical protein